MKKQSTSILRVPVSPGMHLPSSAIFTDVPIDPDRFNRLLWAKMSFAPTSPITPASHLELVIRYGSEAGPLASFTVLMEDLTSGAVGITFPAPCAVPVAADFVLCIESGVLDGSGVLSAQIFYEDPAMRVLDDDF